MKFQNTFPLILVTALQDSTVKTAFDFCTTQTALSNNFKLQIETVVSIYKT